MNIRVLLCQAKKLRTLEIFSHLLGSHISSSATCSPCSSNDDNRALLC